MMIFLDIYADHMLIASMLLVLFGIAFTLFGGLNAVIWSDLVQVVLYVGAALLALALFATSILCFYWQRNTDTPLLEFVLGVMAFAYSGLLDVFGVALFTRRGSTTSVIAALGVGFAATLGQQRNVVEALGLPEAWATLAFPWQLCIGTALAFLTCLAGRQRPHPA